MCVMMGKTSEEGGIVQEQWVGSAEQKPLRKSVGKIDLCIKIQSKYMCVDR